MTAEIAIFNKSAVALAADSAVTVGVGEKRAKIYNSANKLFTLSKYAPVGVMVFGAAYYKGVPWEVLVKMFRNKLGNRRCKHLKDYGDKFVKFIEANHTLFPKEEKEGFFYRFLASEYSDIRKAIEEAVKKHIEINKSIDATANSAIVTDCIAKGWDNIKSRFSVGNDFARDDKTLKTHGKIITRAIGMVFEKQEISPGSIQILENIAQVVYNVWGRKNWGAGIVIAGFGEDEIFPAYELFRVNSFTDNQLKHQKGNRISFDNTAIIVPFAQDEMVHVFMDGINPDYREALLQYMHELCSGMPKLISDGLSLPEKEKEVFLEKVRKAFTDTYEKFKENLSHYERRNHSEPIIDMVASLPKDELANMAESLVNLTSFKRKISKDDETVGGPIDVAVISKYDGFIWIKRKHYFHRDLNYPFFSNYFIKDSAKREGKDATQQTCILDD